MIYLAAPFFNDHELDVVIRMESMLDKFTVFSPRSLGMVTKDNREMINRKNIAMLKQSDLVIAWIDRLMPPFECIAHIRELPGQERELISRDLVKPDDGVLFEVGYATACPHLNVVLFTLRKIQTVNVMLIENVEGVISGWNELLRLTQADLNDSKNIRRHLKAITDDSFGEIE